MAGAGNNAGRCIARAKAAVNSWLVTGFGAVRFTGPEIGFSNAKTIALIWSCKVIHDHHCLPLPSFPPRPKRNKGNIFPSAPPVGSRTKPVRIFTVRTSWARSAAASHSRQTAARKSSPTRSVSTTALFPLSPYQPIADAEMKTCGFSSATALAIAVVPRRREFRISLLYFLLQRLSPTPTPAR